IMSGRITRPADIREQIPVGLLQIGITRMFGSNLSGARSSLIEAYERAPESSRAHIGAGAASKLALIAALGGDTLEAERWRKRMPGHPERSEWLRSQLGLNLGLLDLAKGITTLDQASATESLHSLADTGSLDPQWLMQNFEPSWSSVIHHVMARHDLLWGDRRAALARLRRHTEESSRWLGDGSTARMLLRADHVDLLLSVGATERARAVLLRSPERPELVATRARLDLLTGRIEAALRRSRDALDEGSAAPSALLQLLVIQAAAHLQLGNSAQADAAFAQAARTIHATGSAFGLIAAPRTVVLELAERARFVDVEPFLSRLPDVFPDRLEIIELSTMERRVLDALGRGYGAPVIAQQFHVSPNTVKSHTHRIYRKLGVTSRSEAVSRATELGLISPQ
ncbi:MAG: response regulator transcription factor, partial [Humibacter sp.]